MIKIIGLTGPTGSGKTTIAKLFEEKGCFIIDCDKIARDVVKQEECINKLTSQFGEDILQNNGVLDRKLLAKKAFENAEQTKKLNDITHPLISNDIEKKIKLCREKNIEIAVIDAPLLFEAKLDEICNKIVTAYAPKEIRVSRIVKRDSITKEQTLERMKTQKNDDCYCAMADVVIDTLQDEGEIEKKVIDIINNVKGEII